MAMAEEAAAAVANLDSTPPVVGILKAEPQAPVEEVQI